MSSQAMFKKALENVFQSFQRCCRKSQLFRNYQHVWNSCVIPIFYFWTWNYNRLCENGIIGYILENIYSCYVISWIVPYWPTTIIVCGVQRRLRLVMAYENRLEIVKPLGKCSVFGASSWRPLPIYALVCLLLRGKKTVTLELLRLTSGMFYTLQCNSFLFDCWNVDCWTVWWLNCLMVELFDC